MNLAQAWKGFWFKEGPYFDLAVMRIFAVGLQCFLLLNNSLGELLYSLNLDSSLFRPLPIFRLLMLPFEGNLSPGLPDKEFIMALYWVTVVAGFLALIGLATNFALVLFSLGCVYVQSFLYSFSDFHHPEAIMMVGLCALALAPSGRVLSVDAVLRSRCHAVSSAPVSMLDYSGRDATWALRFIQCFFALMYISAAVAKFAIGGLEWANGFTLQYKLVQDGFRKGIDFALWASQFHFPILISQIVVLFFQSTYFLVIFFPRLRWIYLPLGLMFHIGIYIALKAPFPQWLVFYAAYIPWAGAIKYFAGQQVVPARTAAAGSA